jgi:hypothetical protein
VPALLSRLAVAAVLVLAAGIGVKAAGPEGHAWTEVDDAALRELVGDGSESPSAFWVSAPELVVLDSVMDYTAGTSSAGYMSTGERLSSAETDELVADLRAGLAMMTGGRITDFANVRIESVAPGTKTAVFRRNQIVAARYRGLQAATGTLGYGGRTARGDVITSGVVMLDHDYDVSTATRHMLRTHELGHALGLNHVDSRKSLMNRHVGSTGLTEFDRAALVILATRSR